MQHGVVQRAMLGVMILDVNADLAKNKGLKRFQGVYIAEVTKGGASDQADLKAGDIIIAVNGKETKKGSELQELIGCCRPDEKVYVTFDRKGKVQTIPFNFKANSASYTTCGTERSDLIRRCYFSKFG